MTGATAAGRSDGPFFGLPSLLEPASATALLAQLQAVWTNQLASLDSTSAVRARTRIESKDIADLEADLDLLTLWFDPIASGRRLRERVAALADVSYDRRPDDDQLVFEVDEGKFLLTPEGRAVMWTLQRHDLGAPDMRRDVLISLDDQDLTSDLVSSRYRNWALQRLTSVTRLLREETATLRPTAVGLLLVLLVNRNTSWERRLPSPGQPEASAAVSAAISAPALAFARAWTNQDRAQAHGLDLYRGWALGELARRLGANLHRADEGVWIDESGVALATDRLCESIAGRPAQMRQRTPHALEAALSEYRKVRSQLNALGLAYERPGVTDKLIADLTRAAASSADEEGRAATNG